MVEGQTDKVVIPALANQLGIFKYSYTIIDCGSKQNIPLYIRLLNKFSIPYVAIYDKDHQEIKKSNPQAIGKADSATKAILDEIINGLGVAIELINDIEEELGYTSGKSGKPYQALQYIKSDEFKLSESFEEKIRKIYE